MGLSKVQVELIIFINFYLSTEHLETDLLKIFSVNLPTIFERYQYWRDKNKNFTWLVIVLVKCLSYKNWAYIIKTTEKKCRNKERHLIWKMSKLRKTVNRKKFCRNQGKTYTWKKSRNKLERLNIEKFTRRPESQVIFFDSWDLYWQNEKKK